MQYCWRNWLHTRETLGEIRGIGISPGPTARALLRTVAAEERGVNMDREGGLHFVRSQQEGRNG